MTNIPFYIFMVLVIANWVKSMVIGSNFSFYRYLRYKNDYMLWYSRRQKYIPPHKRQHFSKKSKS